MQALTGKAALNKVPLYRRPNSDSMEEQISESPFLPQRHLNGKSLKQEHQ